MNLIGNEKSEKLDSLDHLEGRDDAEKENLSASKPEMAKLNIEPQQMKKKKKGGFNLRKSLAWNHAFFTEEGNHNFPFLFSWFSSFLFCC